MKSHRQAIYITLILYMISTWTSMAGMEIFGWLTFVLAISYGLRGAHTSSSATEQDIVLKEALSYLPWRTMVAIYAITIIGILVNGTPDADYNYALGHPRWIFLLLSGTYALALFPPSLKGYRVFLVITSVIAVYAIFQSFTGIDLLRPGSNRAVQGLDVKSGLQLWRSAGLFGSPMGYVYIAGMYACLPLAVALTFPQEARRLKLFSLTAFTLIAVSLVTTYVRGAWIAMALSFLTIAWLANRKLFYWGLGAGTAAFTALFVSLVQFRERFLSLFDFQYTSNSDRLLLWKMNLQMWQDYPILGIGWGENETRAREYITTMGYPEAFTGHAHNNYLEALAGTGLLGLMAFLFFIGFFFWLTWRLWKRLPQDLYWARALTLACLGAQIHLHIGGFTECNFKAGATSHNLMIVLALVASMSLLEAKGLLRLKMDTNNIKNWPRI